MAQSSSSSINSYKRLVVVAEDHYKMFSGQIGKPSNNAFSMFNSHSNFQRANKTMGICTKQARSSENKKKKHIGKF